MVQVVILVALTVATLAVAYSRREHTLKAPLTIITFGLSLALVYGVISVQRDAASRDRRRQDHDIAIVKFNAEVGDYNACLSRAAGRSDVRLAFIDLYDYADAQPTATPGATTELRKRLDELIPPLDASTCPKPTPITDG